MTTTTIYLLLIEITVLISSVVALLIHRGRMNPGMNFGGKMSHQKHHQTLSELENRELVPWGWPNHQSKSPTRTRKLEASEAMVALMECIMMEKRLITEGDLDSFDGVHPGSHHLDTPRTDNVGVNATAVQGNETAASAESNG